MSDREETAFWSSRIALIAGLFLGALILGGGVMFFLLPSSDQKGLIVIEASQTPYKAQPDEVGGKTIDHKDKDVFGLLDQLKEAEKNGELLKLPDPAPEMPPLAVDTADESSTAQAEAKPVETQTAKNASAVQTLEAKQTDNLSDNLSDETSGATSTATASGTGDNQTPQARTTKTAQSEAPKTEAPKAEAPKADPPKAAPKPNRIIKKPVVEAGGDPVMMVQIAAFKDQAKAEEVAAVMSNKHKDRLMGLVLGVMPTDTANGVYWRVITEALPEPDARKICDSLKRSGQDCIIRKIKPAG